MHYEFNKELYHHGIKGQKWGVRRYQNPDGTLTAAGRKRLAKGIAKQKFNSLDDATRYISQNINSGIIKNSNELASALKDYRNAANRHNDFYDSKDAADASKKAYDDTYKWYQKNDPEYLADIIKKNNGDKASLDRFHDFRKSYEGFEDEYLSDAYTKYYENPSNKKSFLNEEAAWEKYANECKKATESLVGEYGKLPLKAVENGPMRGNYYDTVEKVVNRTINEYADELTRHK